MKTFKRFTLYRLKVLLGILLIFLAGGQTYGQVPANDLCGSATPLTSAFTCSATAGTLTSATVSVPAVTTSCGTAGADVWYSFVAQSVYPTITLSSLGSSLTPGTNARIQLLSGTCGSLSSLGCVSSNIFNTAAAYPTGLTPGTTYYIRIYSNTLTPAGTTWDFAICVTDPPVNDLCSNATALTSAAACTPVAGTLNNAAVSIPAITGCGTTGGDVWYSFVAQSVYPTITLGSLGTSLTPGTNARIQLLSGACGSLTPLGCVSSNIFNTAAAYPTGLIPGTTYYIRIYSNTLTPAGTTWDFAICVTDPPVNDLCSNAVSLTSATTCNPVAGTLNNAAVSVPGVVTACTTAGGDVWYSFVAQSVYPTITLSSLGTSLTPGTNARIQLLSGACGSLVSLGCVSASTFYTAISYPTGLTPGNTYYVRIYSSTLTPAGATWDFAICVTDPPVNDLCTNAVPLTSGVSCTTVTGTVNYATFTTGTTTTCAGASVKYDVWYSFTAQSANPTITLSNIGANFLAQNPGIQVFSGGCGALTSIGCAITTAYTAPLGLTVGNTYLVRIYSTTGTAPATLGNFDICIQDPVPPANDECAGAILLTSALTCNNITNTVANSTPSAGVPAACIGIAKYDVWYSFVAQTTNPSIKLTTIGATFNGQSPKTQLFSGTCGSLVSIGCSGTTYIASGLTVGATYYLRVYSVTASAVPGTLGNFDICITDPPPPVNDNCSGAISLTSTAACSTTSGTLLNSTPTTGIPGDCGDPASPEVWYSFTANSAYPNITLGSLGAQFTAAGPRIQLLTGTCGSLSSVACISGTSVNAFLATAGAGLTIGNTYYIRIYTNTGGMSGANWGFNICVTDPPSPTVDYGKSYVNITKGSGGGTIEPGDELEMRTTIAVRSNYAFNTSFTGSIPANTTYVPGTLRILTNEGKIYKQWTDAADGDPATIAGSTVTFNLGQGATQTMAGVMKSSDRPVASGGTMIIVSYHVIVNAVSFGTQISVGGGTFTFSNSSATPNIINFPAVTAIVYKNYGICTNTIGNNGILSESGGTFGSGIAKDRAASANIPVNYTYTTFTTGSPGDYLYGMSNNTSAGTAAANYSIDPNDFTGAHRVFGYWDIIGDHTGASDPLMGNLPADVNNGQSGGYMAVINASYRTDTAFLDTVKNLCPNTSYEYSAWFRNICRKCGIDSTGKSWNAVGYVPTGLNDTSGVHPNLTFNINAFDYYTTGDMGYTGQWVKKGFTYRTGPTETQMIINIRNNAPGGGGNDWAIDDIGVASCTPTLDVNPADPVLKVCYADGASISAQVKSYFDNYTYYVWERSTDSGATYVSTPFTSNGTIFPVFNGSEYEYSATGPSFIGDSTTHNNIFRLRVASSASNLADTNCSFLATRLVHVYVNNCMWLLKTDFVTVSGSVQHNLSAIQWTTVNETAKTGYEIEKSTDGIHFTRIGKIKANGPNGNGAYKFDDPAVLNEMGYYRIKLVDETGFKYSKTMLLNPSALHLSVQNLVNPFATTVSYNVIIPADGDIRTTIFDMYGRAVKTYKQTAAKGVSPFKMQDLGALSGGTYFLKVEWQNESVIKKIIKSN
ncbi:MAG: T9SS type A sorting domain-containing protein [Chitinophagaceae bacterium]